MSININNMEVLLNFEEKKSNQYDHFQTYFRNSLILILEMICVLYIDLNVQELYSKFKISKEMIR